MCIRDRLPIDYWSPSPLLLHQQKEVFRDFKLIKTYLRSTMTEKRLNGLAIISIESETAQKINIKSLIDEFATKEARRIEF